MKPDIDFFEHFLDEKESAGYLERLTEKISWKQKTIKIFGKDVLEPRLTAWYGDTNAAYAYSGTKMTPLPWIPELLEIKSRLEKLCKASFNSVLLNLYRDQHDSMGLHSDDEKELGPAPVIASVSLGATRKFILKPRNPLIQKPLIYILTSGSLLVMRGTTQKLWKHGVPKEAKPCGPRINLTFRKIH